MIITQALKACTHIGDLQRGLTIYHRLSSSLKNDSYILASLIHLYMQCGDVTTAQSLFNKSAKKTLSMFGAMMKGYIQNNQINKAIALFNEIESPDAIIVTLLFNACGNLGTNEALNLAKTVFKQIPQYFHSDVYLLTSFMDALMKCGDVLSAQTLFDTSTKKTLPMYGVMMKGYIQNNQASKAIELFNKVENPGEILITLLFNACAESGTTEALDLVKKVLKQIPISSYSNPRLLTSLLDALMKCGDVASAQSLFDSSTNKTLSMFGAMMQGYVKNNQASQAIKLFNQVKKPSEITMIILFNACGNLGTNEALNLIKKTSKQIPKSSYSNPRLLTSLLDALMKCGDITSAQTLFDTSTKKTLPMYGVMMKGYIQNNQASKAIELFNETDNPDEILITLLFNACAELGTTEALDLVKKVLKQIPISFYSNPRLSTSLLDALIKCGDYSSAEQSFSRMKKSVINYGILMSGFNKENQFLKTLNLFNQMKVDDIQGDFFIYLNVIKAVSKIGSLSISERVVEQIPKSLLVNDQIQNALVDMWGKTGCVDKARQVFKNIHQPDQTGYTTMINCYGLNGMGIQSVQLFREMPSELINEVTYICVLNSCSHSGLINEARSIFDNIQLKTEKIYVSMVDCFSRAALFQEAQGLIDEFERLNSPSHTMYMAFLSGARNEKNTHLSQQIFDRMKKNFPKLNDSLTTASILLGNVYGSSGELEKASNIRIQLNKSGAKKKIGLAWTEINGEVFEFRAHDKSHPRSEEIYIESEKISNQLIEHGHQYDSSWVMRALNQDETIESVLCGHSERLAIAWNFVVNPNATRIQITKNLRVCGDCHRATKLIALIRQCEIIVRDANRIHHFYKNGQCSCNDYF